MIKYLKQGKQAEEKAIDNQKVKGIVENIISDIERRGDEAVSQYSGQFDKWTPESFRLSREEIDACYEQLTEQEIAISNGRRNKFETLRPFSVSQ